MCESDDTDILLLIPPDYYVVPSTDDSLRNTPRLPLHQRMEPLQASVVNKLVSQVNTIQNRLSVIESQSESVDNSPIKNSKSKPFVKNRRISKYRGRLSLDNENLKNSSIISPQTTPKKSLRHSRMYSLNSTPSTTTSTDFDEILNNPSHAKQNTLVQNLPTRYDPSGNSIDSLNVSFSPPKRRGSNLTLREIDERYKSETQDTKLIESDEGEGSENGNLKHVYENQSILTEIQTFLRCVDCIKSHINGKDSPDSSLDLSFITSPQFKAIAQRHFNRKVLTNGVKNTKIEKIKKPKGSQIKQFLEKNSSQIENNIQTSSCPLVDTSNITINSTISLMNSYGNLNNEAELKDNNFSHNNSYDSKNVTAESKKDDTVDKISSCHKQNSIQVIMEPKEFKSTPSENFLHIDDSKKSIESPQNTIQEALYILSNIQLNNQNNDEKETLQTQKTHSESSATNIVNQTKIQDQESILMNKLIEKQNKIENKENQPKGNDNIEIDNDFQENLKQWHSIISKLQEQFDKSRIQETIEIPNTALVSLSSLWSQQEGNSNAALPHVNIIPINQKIEEERYRREHCERLIEALQIRLLESQEKLSVALKVDVAKDQAIEKLRDTCLIAQERCKKFESDKDIAINELREIQKKLQSESDNTQKKIEYYQYEINKALEVANASQNEAQQIHNQMDELKKELEKSVAENIKLCEKVNQLQQDVQNDKQLMAEIRNAASETKSIITTSQTEIIKLQEERQLLQRKLSEEKIKITQLENETKNVKHLLEESKQNEKKLTLDNQNLIAEMDRTKSELRTFYQRQVETLVKDKRDEYQAQLDSVEKTWSERISAEKLEVAKTAAQFMRETVDKHRLEIRLLEERHKEEIKLCDLKRQQSEMTVQSLTNKLHRQQLSRSKLASKLHDLIESQWREALRIVTTNGGSPIGGSNLSLAKPDSSINIQKLLDLNLGDDFLRTESDPKFIARKLYSSRPNSAPDELPTSDRNKDTRSTISKPDVMSMRRMRQGTPVSVTSEQSDIPFGNEDQMTYRSMNPQQINHPSVRVESDETPLTTRQFQKVSKNVFPDGELQMYMKMLLEKTESDISSFACFNHRDPASGDYNGATGSTGTNDHFNTAKICKDTGISKPPWK